ncbi:MAG: hypothetical protein AAF355_06990 [Myxococcota bacterium]
MEGRFRSAVHSVRDDLERATQLMRETYKELNQSLQRIEEGAERTFDAFRVLQKGLGGDEENETEDEESQEPTGFVDITSSVLQGFVDELVRTSKDSIALSNELDRVMEQMRSVVKITRRVQRDALATKLISLNASVQAANSEAAHTQWVAELDTPEQEKGISDELSWAAVFRVFARSVRALSESSQDTSEGIHDAVEMTSRELSRMKVVLDNMASRDLTGAMESKSQVEVVVSALSDANTTVEAVARENGQHTVRAVQALQFDDIITQLLAGAMQKLTLLEDLVARVIVSGNVPPEFVRSIQGELDNLEQMSNHVTQENVEAGDVELF